MSFPRKTRRLKPDGVIFSCLLQMFKIKVLKKESWSQRPVGKTLPQKKWLLCCSEAEQRKCVGQEGSIEEPCA